MANILLAEDDSSMREFLARALRRAGHEVAAVGDGLAALETIEQQTFDLLLADVVMPGMNGRELGEKALDNYTDIKTVTIRQKCE